MRKQKKVVSENTSGIWILVILFFAFAIWKFPSLVPKVAVTVNSPVVPRSNPVLKPGWVLLHEGCQPEREKVAKQLQEAILIAEKAARNTVPYMQERVQGLLDGIKDGSVCLQSEQSEDYIVPHGLASIELASPLTLVIYLGRTDPTDDQLGNDLMETLTHEALHKEQKGMFPRTREGFIEDELEVRRKVCRYGIEPAQRQGYQFSWRSSGDCENQKRDSVKWERAIRLSYGNIYDAQHSK